MMRAAIIVMKKQRNSAPDPAFEKGSVMNVKLTSNNISVFESHQSSLESPRPLYRILVMSDGNNRFAMQFCEGTDIYELKAGEAIGNYVESLNKKDSDAFIVCYENVCQLLHRKR